MALPEYHERQRSLLAGFARAVMRLLGLSAGKPLSPQRFNDLADTLTETANSAREEIAALAFTYYQELRPEGADVIGPPTITPLPREYFTKTIESHRDSLESEDNSRAGITRITQAAVRSAENAGRETIQAATRFDPEALGWARVLTGAESCGWCAMLASRGPVYKTAKTAGQSDDWHLGCDCLVVPVFRGQETQWEGYEAYQRLEQLWMDSTKSTSGKGSLKAFDRAFAKQDAKRYSPITRA